MDENIVKDEWLEFKCGNGSFINIKKSEIEYVCEDSENMTEVGVKSGSAFQINMPYKKVMELV